jgi:hypothetical protein
MGYLRIWYFRSIVYTVYLRVDRYEENKALKAGISRTLKCEWRRQPAHLGSEFYLQQGDCTCILLEALVNVNLIFSTFREELFSIFRIASPAPVRLFNVNLKNIKIKNTKSFDRKNK